MPQRILLLLIFLLTLIYTGSSQATQDFQQSQDGADRFDQNRRSFRLVNLTIGSTTSGSSVQRFAHNGLQRGQQQRFSIATPDGSLFLPLSLRALIDGPMNNATITVTGNLAGQQRFRTSFTATTAFEKIDLAAFANIPVSELELSIDQREADYIAIDDFTWTEPKVLPITLLSFHATLQQNGDVLLKWRTTAESTNTYFIISKSSNDGEFNSLDTVKVNGIPTGEFTYTLIDRAIEDGKHYYKLTEHYADGRERQLDIRMVRKNEKPAAAVIFPNPVKGDGLTINAWVPQAKGITYTIRSLGGIAVAEGTLTMPQQTIPIGNLKKGIYWLQLSNGEILQWIKD